MKPTEIVVIEDNSADVLLVKMAIEEQKISYVMTHFGNGLEAMHALCDPAAAQNGSVPDIILLDLNTPRSDGFEVLLKLKNTPHLAGVPIAVLTTSRAQSDRRRAYTLGARYIEKPSQLSEFLTSVGQAVSEMLSRKRAAG